MTNHTVQYGNGKKIAYIAEGPEQGPLIIFVHGWPGVAETWKPQLTHFASLGFRVVALDTPGYGNSTANKVTEDYSLENLVAGLVALLGDTGRKQAVWVGHDWGSGLVWSLVAHHPELCVGVVNLAVPYLQLELGLEQLLTTINRDIYHKDEHPNGQWDYQVFYETNFEDSVAFNEKDIAGFTKACYVKGNPASFGKPARTAGITKAGGWNGGSSKPPSEDQIPDSMTVLTPEIWEPLKAKMLKTGYWPANSYYSNHKRNRAYFEEKAVNKGMLSMPVLFIEAKYDAVCATALDPKLTDPMRQNCKDLTEASVETGHWAAMEKPEEVNSIIGKWLGDKLPSYSLKGVKL